MEAAICQWDRDELGRTTTMEPNAREHAEHQSTESEPEWRADLEGTKDPVHTRKVDRIGGEQDERGNGQWRHYQGKHARRNTAGNDETDTLTTVGEEEQDEKETTEVSEGTSRLCDDKVQQTVKQTRK